MTKTEALHDRGFAPDATAAELVERLAWALEYGRAYLLDEALTILAERGIEVDGR